MGCTLIVVFQAIMHMAVSVGLMPVTGQPLPLISRGGTSTLITCVYFGIILSVSHYGVTDPSAQKENEEPDEEINENETFPSEDTPIENIPEEVNEFY